jgi:hypothetical protein
MRMVLTSVLLASLIVAAPPAAGQPATNCPPACNRIPGTAWISPLSIPLHSRYDWPELSGVAVTARPSRFRFEELCASPPVAQDPRSYAVAERAVVNNAEGEWQLQAQVLHWPGATWWGGELALDTFTSAVDAVRACQQTNAAASPSVTSEEPGRLAAAVGGPVILHQYLLADPVNSTVTELALWSNSPPRTPWPAVIDETIFDSLGAPLCVAYIGSCP